MVLKDSPWGKYYQQKKEDGHVFCQHSLYHSHLKMEELVTAAGFVIEREISTLLQCFGQVKEIENPREGYSPDAGFTVIVAGKNMIK